MSEYQPSFVLKKAGNLLIKNNSLGGFSVCVLPVKCVCKWSLEQSDPV